MKNAQFAGALLAACVLIFAAGCSSKDSGPAKNAASSAPPPATVKAAPISLTRAVTLPSRVVADPAVAPADAGILSMSEGGDDEPPEGPTSFDLLPDGGFVVADPLRQRVVFYDPTGKFRSDLLIYFSAERLRALPNNGLSAVRYQTGERYIFEADAAGRYAAPRLATAADPDPDAVDSGTAQLDSGNQAIVNAKPAPGVESAPIAIRFDALGEGMVGLRRLGMDTRQRTFVAIEAAFPGQRVDVRMIVRKYSARGENLVEILDIPLDYFVHPVDEFRIHDGVLYQLMPKASEVRINIWDTNSRP